MLVSEYSSDPWPRSVLIASHLCKDSYSFGLYYVIGFGYFKYAPSPLFVAHLTS